MEQGACLHAAKTLIGGHCISGRVLFALCRAA
jgi:hypothetical protein